MLKFFIYCMLLWHGIGIITARNEFSQDKISAQKSKNRNERLIMNDWNIDDPSGSDEYREDIQVFNWVGPAAVRNKIRSDTSRNCCSWKQNNGYVATNGKSALKLHLRKLPWNRARSICTEEGGHLAIPEMDSEVTEILKIMIEDSVDDAWLGIHDQFDEADWITVLDEPFPQTRWARGSKLFSNNPDTSIGEKNCARLVKNSGGMETDVCELPKSFVCKMSIF